MATVDNTDSETFVFVESSGGPNDTLWGKTATEVFTMTESAVVNTGTDPVYEAPFFAIVQSMQCTATVIDFDDTDDTLPTRGTRRQPS